MMPSPPIHDRIDTPPFLAGSQPAAPRLAPVHQIGPQSRRQSPHTMRSPLKQPTRLPLLGRKPIVTSAPRQPPQAIPRGEIPIAPAAPSVPHTPRFRALALSDADRRSAWMVLAFRRPKTLYGACRCQEKLAINILHIIRLHCGTAARLLGCAERLEPRSRVRRAEGAGLDRECADRATISLLATTNVQRALFDLLLFLSFSPFIHMRA